MPAKKKDTKIVAHDKNQRAWIYVLRDPVTHRVFYVGRTSHVRRRGLEHDRNSSACKLLRERLRLANFTAAEVIELAEGLPNGVPASRASEFEAFFIIYYKTLYDPSDPDRISVCNQKHGDHVAALDYEAVKAEVAVGVEWTEVPDNVIEARAKEAVLEELVADLGEQEPELCTALAEATMARKKVERMYMSPVSIAETLASEYDALPKYKTIDRTVFEADVNSLRDKLNNEDVIDDKMLGLVRAIALFGKSEGAEWEMRAKVGGHLFRGLAGALETREEARLPDTLAVKNMKMVRDWSVDNDGKKPIQEALKRKDGTGTQAEHSLGGFLSQWKTKKGYNMADKPSCDFLMRNLPWWHEFVDGMSKQEKSDAVAAKVNEMLIDGYGHTKEPEFEGKKKWPCGPDGSAKRRAYNGMKKNLVGGRATIEWVEKALKNVDPVRASWYMAQRHANRPTFLAQNAESRELSKERGYANGVKKRQRTTTKDDDEEEEEEEEDEEEEAEEEE